MTKRQANTLMGLGVAIILTQILCTAILVSKMDSTQNSARSAEASSVDAMEYSKRLESRNASDAGNVDRRNVPPTAEDYSGGEPAETALPPNAPGVEPLAPLPKVPPHFHLKH